MQSNCSTRTSTRFLIKKLAFELKKDNNLSKKKKLRNEGYKVSKNALE